MTTYVDPRYCPDGWDMRVSKEGNVYFAYHPAMTTAYIDPRGLPEGWEACLDDLGRVYFKDHSTKSTTWDDPRKTQPDTVLKQWKQQEMLQWLMKQVSKALADMESEPLLEG